MKYYLMAAGCAVMFALPCAGNFQDHPNHDSHKTNASLTLNQALIHALKSHPDLDVAEINKQILATRKDNMRLRPSPTLELSTENIAGSGDYSSFDQHETTLALAQTLELGGKRAKRNTLATLDLQLANWDKKTIRAAVLRTTYLAYIDALTAQHRRTQEKEKLVLAEQIDAMVQARVEAGKVSPLVGTKSRINLAEARVHWQQAEQRFHTVRNILSGHLGNQVTRFEEVRGNLTQIKPPPIPEKLTPSLKNHPDLARQSDEQARQKAQLGLVSSERVPNLTLSAGYRKFGVGDDRAWVLGLSLPLPSKKRNRLAMQEARFQVKNSIQKEAAIQHHLWIEFAEIYENLIGHYQQVKALAEEILPAAKMALEGTTEGYREGKFSYLEVLDSQRTYFEIQTQHTDALGMFHRYKVELQALLGRDLTKIELGAWING